MLLYMEETCLTNIADLDPELQTYNHEEADTGIVLHILYIYPTVNKINQSINQFIVLTSAKEILSLSWLCHALTLTSC